MDSEKTYRTALGLRTLCGREAASSVLRKARLFLSTRSGAPFERMCACSEALNLELRQAEMASQNKMTKEETNFLSRRLKIQVIVIGNAMTGTRTPTSSMGSSNSTLELSLLIAETLIKLSIYNLSLPNDVCHGSSLDGPDVAAESIQKKKHPQHHCTCYECSNVQSWRQCRCNK